jgi:thiol-disulfide isomerase/thioredoxin
MLTRSLTFALCLFAATSAVAQIKPGEKAQPLHITDWISNVPESKSLAGKLLVIDFWATWCQPCIASTPHMNELVKGEC